MEQRNTMSRVQTNPKDTQRREKMSYSKQIDCLCSVKVGRSSLKYISET